ncbi:MAG: hypothetical protein KatS3mg033_0442 [Thermonema sp.]|uniref:hypothetical protein n=1 Tax=Thermonema TaxID=28194 RepID=UPI000571F949|nr:MULTISPECIES: hypothetical protein [Thermonema]GIV38642.1 MAG: hypothetical protein KatS3mg033_0442 [Thermonema sp.]
MKKDIEFPNVEGVKVAIVKKENIASQDEWYVYILNTNPYPIHTILITAKGYGEIDGEKRKTSTLRYHIEELPPESYAMIEPIHPDVFSLYSEYWVSYYVDKQIFDKKYIFPPDSIQDAHLTLIKPLNMPGILHE